MSENIFLRFYSGLVCAVFSFLFLIGVVGCGPTYSEKEKIRTENRKELKEQQLKKELEIVDGLREKYRAIDFPWGVTDESSDDIFNGNFFSALAQRFLSENKQEPIILMMYLEDIEQSRNGLVAKFIMELRPGSVGIPKELKLSLAISEDQFTELKAMRLRNSLPRKVVHNSIAVVAKINDISSMKGAVYDDDGKSSLKSELHGSGVLIDAKLRIEK